MLIDVQVILCFIIIIIIIIIFMLSQLKFKMACIFSCEGARVSQMSLCLSVSYSCILYPLLGSGNIKPSEEMWIKNEH